MKTMLKVLSLAAILAASAPLALADPIDATISAGGVATYSVNSGGTTAQFNFVNPGEFEGFGSQGTTVDPYFTQGDLITFTTGPFTIGPVNSTVNLGGFQIATATNDGEILTYFINSYTVTALNAGGALVNGTGFFTETCAASPCGAGDVNYDQTNAIFSLSVSTSGSVAFGATADTPVTPTVPEPGSLMLLGTGLLTAVGVARRKFKA